MNFMDSPCVCHLNSPSVNVMEEFWIWTDELVLAEGGGNGL